MPRGPGIKKLIVLFLDDNLEEGLWFPAVRIAEEIKRPLGSVASYLTKLTNEGLIRRDIDKGSRGGYGYRSLKYAPPAPNRYRALRGKDLL